MMIPLPFDEERFSRWMAYVLRHNPTRYGLEPDRHGFVDVGQFVLVATRRYPDLTEERLQQLVAGSLHQRFELAGNLLRARYGHSIPVEPVGEPVEPPERLYHGAESGRMAQIFAEGLKPMDRRMVHLSETIEDALSVARRKIAQPIVFRVLAKQAHASGVSFYHEGKIYLTREVPPEFLALETLAEEPPATLDPQVS
jgi:putative RNA 2'-phosphotransferase